MPQYSSEDVVLKVANGHANDEQYYASTWSGLPM